MTAQYLPGAATLLVSGVNAVLLPECPAALREELWSLFADSETCSVADLLDLLARDGIGTMGDFTAVLARDTTLVTLTRGRCTAAITTRKGDTHEVSGQGVSTWAERHFPRDEVHSLVLTAGQADPVEAVALPLERGVVLASQVVLGAAAPNAPRPADPVVHQAPTSEPAIAVTPVVPEPEEIVEVDQEPSSADPAETLAEPDDSMDHLWGATVARSPEDAAVRVTEPAASAPLITGVPGPSERVPDPDPEPAAGDHDGLTVSRSALAAIRVNRMQEGASREAAAAPRVPRATLVLSDGASVLLDRPVFVGRAPKAFNNTSSHVPKLVTVASPQGFVSSTHVEFHLEEDKILVRDVSRNGTLLVRPGSEPERLDHDVMTLVSDGCVLDLGDEITVRISFVER